MSKNRVAIIDYGCGNLYSLKKALVRVGAKPSIASRPEDINSADILFLPGVGAFGKGMTELRRRGFVEPLKACISKGVSLFGICLGMQFLFENSEEFGMYRGLGLLQGDVTKLIPQDAECKVPHVGWNTFWPLSEASNWDNTILKGLSGGEQAYFTHSYAAQSVESSSVVALTEYGGARFASVIAQGTVFGTQFHPEKSGEIGLQILKNFLEFV
ncbi:MAG: imidazole glycerol phosphate synthase subunit HisH [bacterium]|nr:imidazole glycerol phosphate synthase subunit HisH [bacterium]